MMISFRNLLLGTLLLAAMLPALAAEPREYEVELLVFQNLVRNDNGEVWPVDYSQWFENDEPQPEEDKAKAKVSWLPASAHHLTAERNALARSRGYRPLAYFAWRQPVLDRQHALPVELPVQPRSDKAWVDGTARVAVGRYLHLYLDLQLHIPRSIEQMDALDYEIPEIRLREHRRMRSGEVHYFDNPRFGVIALITPVKDESGDKPQAVNPTN